MIADSSSRNQRHNEAPPFLGDFYASEVMNIAEGVRRGGAREEIGGLTWLGIIVKPKFGSWIMCLAAKDAKTAKKMQSDMVFGGLYTGRQIDMISPSG